VFDLHDVFQEHDPGIKRDLALYIQVCQLNVYYSICVMSVYPECMMSVCPELDVYHCYTCMGIFYNKMLLLWQDVQCVAHSAVLR
jgi:hypothetical protein